MTTEKHDPWALLREAKQIIAANRLMLGHYSGAREVERLEDRIDAALAEHADSATPVVESDDLWWTPSSHRAKEGKYEMHVWRMSLKQWGWSTCVYQEREVGNGLCNTLDEAKSAAIAAARGMK
jgi:hypothetical protein